MIPKFRAWLKLNKIMVDVSVIDFKNGLISYSDINEKLGYIESLTPNNVSKFEDIILMQSTGILDENGKEVYIGDILDTSYSISTVKYGEYINTPYDKFTPFFGFYLEEVFYETEKNPFSQQTTCITNAIYVEIIGNIYENPELLTKEKDNA